MKSVKTMKTLSDAKMLGGIGSILLLVGLPIPQIGFALAIVGLILQFIAVKKIAATVNDDTIFSNFLLNFVFGLIAFGSVIVVFIVMVGSLGGLSFFTALEGMNTADPTEVFSYLSPLLSGCLIALVIMWVFSLIGAIFLRKSYEAIAEKTNVSTFKTTGLLYLIGTATFIILIGFLILLIARIFEIVSYFSLPDTIQTEKNIPRASSDYPSEIE